MELNKNLNSIAIGLKMRDVEYWIAYRSIDEFLEFFDSKLKELKECSICGGSGWIGKTVDEIERLQDKMNRNLRKAQLLFNEENALGTLIIKTIENSLKKNTECSCNQELKKYKKRRSDLLTIANLEKLYRNYEWEIGTTEFRDYKEFRTHYTLSRLAKKYNYMRDSLVPTSSLWLKDEEIRGLDLNEIPGNIDFVYLTETGETTDYLARRINMLKDRAINYYLYKDYERKTGFNNEIIFE